MGHPASKSCFSNPGHESAGKENGSRFRANRPHLAVRLPDMGHPVLWLPRSGWGAAGEIQGFFPFGFAQGQNDEQRLWGLMCACGFVGQG